MVGVTDPAIVDVVVLVEDTALGSTSIQEIKNNYLIPTLEHFNGGPATDVEFASLETSSTYSIVPFRASDCMPDPPARILGPFTSTKKILTIFDRLKFSGGRGAYLIKVNEQANMFTCKLTYLNLSSCTFGY